jgi:hypothetical protein
MFSYPTPNHQRFARKLLCLVALVLYANPAAAHVKWFCTYDVAAPPQPIPLVLNGDFGNLTVLTIAVLLIAGWRCYIHASGLCNTVPPIPVPVPWGGNASRPPWRAARAQERPSPTTSPRNGRRSSPARCSQR